MKSLINIFKMLHIICIRHHFDFHWLPMFFACVSKYYCVFVALIVNTKNISADSTLKKFLLQMLCGKLENYKSVNYFTAKWRKRCENYNLVL